MNTPPALLTPDILKQPFWSIPSTEVTRILQSGTDGLTGQEAERRLKTFGPNRIKEKTRLTKTKIVINQFRSPLILALVVAGGVTTVLQETIDAVVIFGAVIANTALGFWQENKAETVLEQLQKYVRTFSRVRRDSTEREVSADSLVPGDRIRVTQGDRVPADARIIFANDLLVDESILTGESLPGEKTEQPTQLNTSLNDRASMLFSGTLVVQGFADAVVTMTGARTEVGRIAALVSGVQREETPLQRSVSRFAAQTGIVLSIMAAILFVIGLSAGKPVIEMFIVTVAVLVSAVPEGLPVALTVILAVGMEQIARKNGVVRKLLAVETLGSTSLILTDKTGTLTQAIMKLSHLIHASRNDKDSLRLLADALLNTDVIIQNPQDPPHEWKVVGRAMETAIVTSAAERGLTTKDQLQTTKILERLPFDSTKKYSLTLVQNNAYVRCVALGAPEILLAGSTLSEDARATWLAEVDKLAKSGERVLAVAEKPATTSAHLTRGELIDGYTFSGIISFHDPLRLGVAAAMKRIESAGVRTVIVTGDHPGTALAIAKKLGIASRASQVMTGQEFAALAEDEILGRIPEIRVFARVTPEQKLHLTELFRSSGEIVAVTGDGVNDAPALSAADIGVAVGSGTDVAKSAADLIILDNNFETIVSAIEEGRRILDNIRKVIVYLLSDAFNELALIGGSLLFGLPLPINALQILYVNFFSDSFPAIAFAFERNTSIDAHRPTTLHERLLDSEMKFLILVMGSLSSASLFVLYYFLLRAGYDITFVQTFIYAGFASYTMFVAFSLRDLKRSILTYNPFSNMMLTAGILFSFALTVAGIYLPLLNRILHTVPLPLPWFIGVLLLGLMNIMGIEIAKWFFARVPAHLTVRRSASKPRSPRGSR